jgi:hypothetical protein
LARPRLRLLAPLLLLALATPAPAADDLNEKKKAAIEKGIAFLKAQETAEGAWSYENLHPKLKAYPMNQGVAALGALALVKSGVPPADPAVKKAVDCVRAAPMEHVYSAGLTLLLLEALLHWEPQDEPGKTSEHKPKKLEQRDLELARRAVSFLEESQHKALWRYGPKGTGEDSSNAQYALLGLDAAERMGLPVSKECYLKAQAFYVENQEKDGPEVPAFSVPGADLSLAELRAIEKETRERLEKIDQGFKGRKPGEPDAEGHVKEDLVRQAEEEAAKKVFKTAAKLPKMHARGFPYTYPTSAEPEDKGYTGSMTASGLACLFICKAHLDGTPAWEKLKGPIDAALRDGAAWLAAQWSVDKNPHRKFHLDYYLYALERASVLNLVPKYGTHDWYGEGCKVLLAQQQADGSFDCGIRTTVGPVVDTMFALLFLSRGTTPVIRLPERIVTGEPAPAPPAK